MEDTCEQLEIEYNMSASQCQTYERQVESL